MEKKYETKILHEMHESKQEEAKEHKGKKKENPLVKLSKRW